MSERLPVQRLVISPPGGDDASSDISEKSNRPEIRSLCQGQVRRQELEDEPPELTALSLPSVAGP